MESTVTDRQKDEAEALHIFNANVPFEPAIKFAFNVRFACKFICFQNCTLTINLLWHC